MIVYYQIWKDASILPSGGIHQKCIYQNLPAERESQSINLYLPADQSAVEVLPNLGSRMFPREAANLSGASILPGWIMREERGASIDTIMQRIVRTLFRRTSLISSVP